MILNDAGGFKGEKRSFLRYLSLSLDLLCFAAENRWSANSFSSLFCVFFFSFSLSCHNTTSKDWCYKQPIFVCFSFPLRVWCLHGCSGWVIRWFLGIYCSSRIPDDMETWFSHWVIFQEQINSNLGVLTVNWISKQQKHLQLSSSTHPSTITSSQNKTKKKQKNKTNQVFHLQASPVSASSSKRWIAGALACQMPLCVLGCSKQSSKVVSYSPKKSLIF